MAKKLEKQEMQLQDDELFLFECLMQKCIEFMRVFELPADRQMLIDLLQLVYNSFLLPSYLSLAGITRTIDLALEKNFLVIHDGLYEFIPFPIQEMSTIQSLTKQIERVNNDLVYFFDYLLMDDFFTLPQLLHLYGSRFERQYF